MKRIVSLLAVLTVTACDLNPGLPSDGKSADFVPTGYAQPVTQENFNQLTAEQKFQLANKLLGTMHKGISADDFFNLSADMSNLQVRSEQNDFINKTRQALLTDLSFNERATIDGIIDGVDAEGNPIESAAKYQFDEFRPRQVPLARIQEYPLSRDMFVNWMAYFLANTILFSPAYEMESTSITDMQNVFRRLQTGISERQSIRKIILSHLNSVSRWRVSRSAENHALEAFELYLGLFETEEDSRRGGIACKDYYLTGEDDGYQLRQNDFPNGIAQIVLQEYSVTNCNDFNNVIASHPLVIPRVTEVIVNYLMAERTLEDRLKVVESISKSGATTFEDVFKGILFSKEFLLNTERPKSFEENLMSMLNKVEWQPDNFNHYPVDKRIFREMGRENTNRFDMRAMGWASMSYKIGRVPTVSLDALSFANYHRAMREEMMRDDNAYEEGLLFNENNAVREPFVSMTPTNYLDFLFITALHRRATADEKTDLLALFGSTPVVGADENGQPVNVNFFFWRLVNGVPTMNSNTHDDMARETYDYISRLPEFYYFTTIN